MAGKHKGLGRGLDALIKDGSTAKQQATKKVVPAKAPPGKQAGGGVREVPAASVVASPWQPRTVFDSASLIELVESVKIHGILQPLLVREVGSKFELIAGERRLRAAIAADLPEVPVIILDIDDREALEIALIENIQRSDLTALEEATGFQRLIEDHGHTQEDVAQAVGKSRSHVANTLRLLSLPDKAREHLEAGRLTAGHARALLVSGDADRLADYVVAGGLSVRATERLVQGKSGGGSTTPRPATGARSRRDPEKDADTRALEQSVTESLGLTVDITPKDADRGALTIHYQSLDQLDDLLAKLTT